MSIYLEKGLPVEEDVESQDIDSCLKTVGTYINANINEMNMLLDKMFEALDKLSGQIERSIISLTDVASRLSDIYAITGNSQDSGDAYLEQIKSFETGVTRDTGTRTFSLDSSSIFNRTIISLKSSSNGGLAGNSVGQNILYDNVNNLIGGISRFEYEKFNDELLLSLDIELDGIYPVNMLEFNVHNLGVKLPNVASIEMSQDGINWEYADIKLSGKKLIDLEMFLFKNNTVKLHTSNHNAKFVTIKFHQQYPYVIYGQNKSRYAIAILNLKVSAYSAIESGLVVLGPFEFSDQVLKASIAASVDGYNFDTRNVTFSISHDALSWKPIENLKIFSQDSSTKKVIDFNTVLTDSILTVNPVFKVWLKIEMTGGLVKKDLIDNNALLRDVGLITNEERQIELSLDSSQVSVYKKMGYKHGGTVPAADSLTATSYLGIVNITNDEETLLKGFGISNDKVFDVTKNLSLGNLTYAMDKVHVVEKEHVYVYTSEDADPSQIVLYKMLKPYRKLIQVSLNSSSFSVPDHIPVFPIKESGGVYSLRTKYGSIKIDLKSRAFFSNSQALYVLPDDVLTVDLYDHIGNFMLSHKTLRVNDMQCISLLDIFSVMQMSIGDRRLNTFYPLSKLEDNQYAIEDGKIIMGLFYSGPAHIVLSRTQKIEHVTGFGTANKPYIILTQSMPTRTDYIIKSLSLVKYVKLTDCNVIPGLIKINADLASFNPFIKEVDFIDGKKEFEHTSVLVQKNNLGLRQITLSSNYSGSDIKFYGYRRPFQNRVFLESELVRYGDWFLQEAVFSTQGLIVLPAKIILPHGVTTDSVLDVEIEYAIIDRSGLTTGLYSVDHVNGVIYSSSLIDPKVRISYLSTNIYARYEALKWVPTNAYSIKDSTLKINDYSDNIAGSYVVVQKSKGEESIQFIELPVIKELRLNVITEREFV